MRVGREAAAGLQFAAKIHELLDAEAAFEKGAGVDAGSGVALEIYGVAFKGIGARAEEMIEADFVERGGGGVGGDVAADIVFEAIGADDHGEGVPANEGLDAALELLIAGEEGFEARGNGVGVRRVGGKRKINAADSGVCAEALHDFAGHIGAAGEQDGIEGFEPFLDFDVLDAARYVSFLIHGSDGLLPSRRETGACVECYAQSIRIHLEGRGCIRGARKIDDGVVREFGWGDRKLTVDSSKLTVKRREPSFGVRSRNQERERLTQSTQRAQSSQRRERRQRDPSTLRRDAP